MLIDSHCHLNYPGLREDVQGVLGRARAAGIGGFLGISTRRNEWDDVIAQADAEPDIWATIGIHPHEADLHPDTDTATLIDAARHARVIGIGETGLDYFYDKSDRARQQGELCRAYHRGARHRPADHRPYPRCRSRYAGAAAKRRVKARCTASSTASPPARPLPKRHLRWVSISRSQVSSPSRTPATCRRSAATIPADRLLVETDAPFLAPVPMRGKTVRTGFVAHTARFLASLRGETPEALAATTTANFFRLFAKARAPQ